MKKSINIIYELSAILAISIGGFTYCFYTKSESSLLFALILICYVIGIISVTLRSIISKQKDRLTISVLFFGMTCGFCYGLVLFLSTYIAENLHITMIMFGILAWSAAGGIIAVFSAYVISFNFIKDLRSIINHKKK